MARNANPEI